MKESVLHIIMKNKAIELLHMIGLSREEIKLEHSVDISSIKKIRADVVGELGDTKIIVECGNVLKRKKLILDSSNLIFIHLPYDYNYIADRLKEYVLSPERLATAPFEHPRRRSTHQEDEF